MSQHKYFLSKSCVPFKRAIRSSVLAGLLLCATYAAVQAESALQSGNKSKLQSGTAASRQLAVLLDDPDDPKGKRYSGYVVWRIETIQETGEKPDVAIRADIEIPERNLKMAISLRRNTDRVPLTSHTIEVTFGKGVGDVFGIRMRQNEQARVEHLAGAALKVDDGFFWVGLSNSDAVQAHNLQLVNELSWLDIGLVYKNRRTAILEIEKGASGREIFEKAFTAWKVQ
jgi:hypothetical protein